MIHSTFAGALLLLIGLSLAGAQPACADGPWKVHETSDTDLFWVPNRLHGLTVTFTTTRTVDVFTMGHVNLKHRCFPGVGPVGYGVSIYYRTAATPAGLDAAPRVHVKGATSSGNVRDCADHYADASLESWQRVGPGSYRYEVWAGSHSSDAWYVDGLLEVNNEGAPATSVNQMILWTEPVTP